jgi:hypothetical protein
MVPLAIKSMVAGLVADWLCKVFQSLCAAEVLTVVEVSVRE